MPMQVVCEQCGTKNRLGVIFCKQCGAKLNLEATHEQLQERRNSFTFDDFKYYFGIFRRVVAWLFLLVFIAVLVGLFLPAKVPPAPVFSNRERQATVERFNTVVAESQGRVRQPAREHEFKQAEATLLANWLLGLDDAADDDIGYALAPQEISVRLLSTRYVRLVLRSKAFKKVSVDSTLVGRFVEGDDGFYFLPISGKIGRVGMPWGLKAIVVERFKPLFSSSEPLQALAKRLDSVDVYDGQLVVKVKRHTR